MYTPGKWTESQKISWYRSDKPAQLIIKPEKMSEIYFMCICHKGSRIINKELL